MKTRSTSVLAVLLTLLTAGSVLLWAEEPGKTPRRKRPESDRPTVRATKPATTRRGRLPGSFLQGLSPEEREKLRQKWRNMSEAEREQFRAEMRERAAQMRPERRQALAPQLIEQQIAKLKAEQQQQINELREILALARKEKAAETAKSLEALIAKRQELFQKNLQVLEQKRLRLQRIRPERPRQKAERLQSARKKAPDFTLKTFDGKQVGLAQLRGKIVVLEWMNFECPFSRYHYQTKTTMADLAKKYKDKGVVWLAINSTSHTTPEKNLEFIKRYNVQYPVLDDRSGRVGKAYGAKTTPHMFVIDKAGRIAYDGAIDNAPLGKLPAGQKYVNYVAEVLDALLAGKPVTTAQTKSYGCSVKYPK